MTVPILLLMLVPSSGLDETELLRQEARGNFPEARQGYQSALLEEDGPLAEYFLERYLYLARQEGTFGAVRETLAGLWGQAAIDPILWGRAGLGLSDALVRLGDAEGALQISGKLGFVTDWLVCGAFDNERGGGFGTEYPPEREFQRDGAYEGKKREVRWVKVPATDPLGWVDLDEMLRPNDECLAYATTFVRSDAERPAALRIGSDEGLKVWVNGRLVLEKEVHRRARRDQDVAGVILRKGWNRILLKVAEREEEWKFALRITDLDGHPIDSLEVTSEPGEPMESASPEGEEPELPTPRPGAMDALERRGEESPEDPLTHFRLGFLHLVRQAGGEEDHTDRDLFSKAMALDPKSSIFPYFHALALRQEVKHSIAKDFNLEREALQEAVSLDESHALAAYRLAVYYDDSLRNRHKARSWIDRALEANPSFPRARLRLANLLADRGWAEEARRERQQVIQESGESLASLGALASSLESTGDLQAASAALEQATRLDRTHRGVRARLAWLQKRIGDPKRSMGIWQEALRLQPFLTKPRLEIAEIQDGLDDLEGAAASLREALEIAPEDDEILDRLGHLLARAGAGEEAEEAWREALRLNPNRVALRRYLEFRSEAESPFEEAIPFDARPLLEQARTEAEEGNEPYRVILRRVLVRVNKDGTQDEYRHEVFKIGNDDGARAFRRYRIGYAGGEQQVKVKEARVIHPDGTVEEARSGREGRSRRTGEFSSGASHGVSLPSLSPGDIVEIRYRRDDLEQSFFGDYFGDVFIFQDRVPVAQASYTLIAPRGRKFYFHLKNSEVSPRVVDGEDGAVVTTWTMTDVPKVEAEAGRPPRQESSPQIHISTFEKWEDLGVWYANLIRSQHEANDLIRKKVEELTAGLTTVERKVRAIYDFVVTEVRYNDAWEFGVHGYKPYKAATIFTRRFGDCKDKSILLNTMLREIGVESHPVLIRATGRRWEEDLTLPMFNHFNHCISYVTLPGSEEGIYLDGTAEYHPWDVIPGSDQGARVLVVEEGGGARRQVPEEPPAENRMDTRYKVTLSLDGSAEIEVQSEATGQYGVMLRAYLPIEERRVEELERLYSETIPGTEVTSTQVGDLKDLVDPVHIRYEMSSPDILRETPEGSALCTLENLLFPYAYARTLSDLSALAERTTDLLLPQPTEVRDEVEVTLPGGTAVVTLPEGREISSPFGTYVAKARQEGDTVHLVRSLSMHPRRVTAAEYGVFRQFCNDVDRARRENVVLRLQEGAEE